MEQVLDNRIEQCLESIRIFVNWYRNRSNETNRVQENVKEPPVKTFRAQTEDPPFDRTKHKFLVTIDPERLILGDVAMEIAERAGTTLFKEDPFLPVPVQDLSTPMENLFYEKLKKDVYPLEIKPLFDKSVKAKKLELVHPVINYQGALDPILLFNMAKNTIDIVEMCPRIIVALDSAITEQNGLPEFINEIRRSTNWLQWRPNLAYPPKNQPNINPTPGDYQYQSQKHSFPYVSYSPNLYFGQDYVGRTLPVCYATFVDDDKVFRKRDKVIRGHLTNEAGPEIFTEQNPRMRSDFSAIGVDAPHGSLRAVFLHDTSKEVKWSGYLPGTQDSTIYAELGSYGMRYIKIKEKLTYEVEGYVVNRT